MNQNSRKRKHEPIVESTTMASSSSSIDLSIIEIDQIDVPQSTEPLEVIDLTVESPIGSDTTPAFVDLTQTSGSSSLRQSARQRRANRRSRQRENRPPSMHLSTHINAISFISDDSDNDLEILPVITQTPTLTERTEPLNTSSAEDPLSPVRKEISCPVCMESERQIKRRRQLVSTVCGHIFCNTCIVNSIKSQYKCPTCRKKLTLKQFHPIFI